MAKSGISIDKSHLVEMNDVAISGNVLGLHLSDSTEVNVSVINIEHNTNGITAASCSQLTLRNAVVARNQEKGMELNVCSKNIIRNVTLKENGWSGMEVNHGYDILIEGSAMVGNLYQGAHFSYTTQLALDHVSMTGNMQYGIQMYTCNTTSLNNLVLSLNGLFMLGCSYATLTNLSYDTMGTNGIEFHDIILEKTTFYKVKHLQQNSFESVLGALTIISCYNTAIVLADCNFTANNLSSVSASNSTITAVGTLVFENITAISGAAFILSGSSVLILSDLTENVVFKNNHVTEYGGAMYIHTKEIIDTSSHIKDMIYSFSFVSFYIISTTKCFIKTEGPRPTNRRMTFINNTAEKGGGVYTLWWNGSQWL